MSVIILSGVSGSGKSFYAKCINPSVIVSADAFFMQDGEYKFDSSKLGDAHADCFRRFIDAVSNADNKVLIVVDNTNISEVEIAPYYLGAEAYGHSAVIHTMKLPFGFLSEKSLDILEKRNPHKVSRHIIAQQHKRLEKRWLPPWWGKVNVPIE